MIKRDVCKEFVNDILEHLDSLFRKRGFLIIRIDLSERKDRCLVILKSELFQIKLYSAPDEINVLIGTLSAPLTWAHDQDGEKAWYFIRAIVNFLRGDYPTPDWPRKVSWSDMTLDRQMDEMSEMLLTYYEGIEDLFSHGNFEKRRSEYEAYSEVLSEKIRREYEEFARRNQRRYSGSE
jgi:hypothetical protein